MYADDSLELDNPSYELAVLRGGRDGASSPSKMLRTLVVTVDFGFGFFLYGFFRDDVLNVGTFSK